MPLSGDYEWSEKADQLKVVVPLRGTPASAVDIFVATSVLKINYAPYLIDIVLKHKVDSIKHKAVVKNGSLVITLFKSIPGIWNELEASEENSDEQRIISSQEHDLLGKELSDKRKERRTDDERFSVRKQMDLDSSFRQRLDGMKQDEKRVAEAEVYAALERIDTKTDAKPERESVEEKLVMVERDRRSEAIFEDSDLLDLADDGFDEDPYVPKSSTARIEKASLGDDVDIDEARHLPPPRSLSAAETKVGVSFTPRVFPTPLRESKAVEEGDWVAKNRRHLKRHGVLAKNLPKGNGVDVSEEDPVWLKAKGDDFYRAGDCLSAVNAYSAAIDTDELNVACISNRSVCYLRLGQLEDCKADCSLALDILGNRMTEAHAVASAEELTMTAKLLLRRGIVNCSLGYFDAAKDDYEELRRRLGGGVQLMEVSASDVADDLSKINIMVEVDALKRKADGMLSQGVAEDAITLYSQALSLFPLHAGCVANRATSYLALGNLDRCIDDTTTALSILEESDKAHVSHARQKGVNVLASILPATGSAKWKAWKMKVLAKRGAAFAQLGQLDAAIRDFAEMCALDPKDAAVKSDLNKLQTLRMQSTSVTSAQSQVQACQ